MTCNILEELEEFMAFQQDHFDTHGCYALEWESPSGRVYSQQEVEKLLQKIGWLVGRL